MHLEHSILKGYCPHLAVIDVAARMSGRLIPSAEIALKGSPRWYRDRFTLQHAAEALTRVGVSTAGLRIDASELEELELPVLVQVKRLDAEEFVVVVRVNDHSVVSYSGHDGWWLESRRHFAQRWNGICLAMDIIAGARSAEDNSKTPDSTLDLQLFGSFLDSNECERLIREATPIFRPSMVSADGSLHSEVYSTGRTSQSATLAGALSSVVIARAAALTGKPEACFEPLQCVKYESGQKFSPHYDVPVENIGGEETSRTWTMLAYLNDDFEGGHTLFPLLDLRVRPIQGGLITFRNRRAGRDIEAVALHAGMPVSKGIKYACNLWCSDHD